MFLPWFHDWKYHCFWKKWAPATCMVTEYKWISEVWFWAEKLRISQSYSYTGLRRCSFLEVVCSSSACNYQDMSVLQFWLLSFHTNCEKNILTWCSLSFLTSLRQMGVPECTCDATQQLNKRISILKDLKLPYKNLDCLLDHLMLLPQQVIVSLKEETNEMTASDLFW